jgi:hypothetical protein
VIHQCFGGGKGSSSFSEEVYSPGYPPEEPKRLPLLSAGRLQRRRQANKSLFASFSAEKEVLT